MVGAAVSVDVEHPDVFEELLGEGGLKGCIAYCLYKSAKREWVREFYARNDRKPNASELSDYVATWTRSRLEGLISEAETSLAEFAETVVNEQRPRILQDALAHRSFWRETMVASFGAFVYTVLLITLAVILKLAHIDLLVILKNVGVDQ